MKRILFLGVMFKAGSYRNMLKMAMLKRKFTEHSSKS